MHKITKFCDNCLRDDCELVPLYLNAGDKVRKYVSDLVVLGKDDFKCEIEEEMELCEHCYGLKMNQLTNFLDLWGNGEQVELKDKKGKKK